MGEDFTEEDNESIDDNDAVLFDLFEDSAEAIWGDGVKNTRTVQRWNWDKIKQHKTDINVEEFGEDKLQYFPARTVK